ncbi:alpha/beta hydrolase [Curtobacterium sp. VKM Ac-2922]|uniref:alpha/beta hydrolase n=1 Tax=Curtobacterium sp. VKM Ac-2922 TaxID=2929475 RepID=UPI001FB1D77B|nr:alpha/beta hydrolase [Curtobacterium sp. VKM Ac-2922]MCJ1713412.1 alpha/beta hydrolase family protein [Curtobacterium sp. VKM Ac-2922]
MADIEFDADSARALATAARAAARTLRGQGGARSSAVTSALTDFDGSYADRFRDAAVVEAEDRGRLVGVLTDLASAVDRSILVAEHERDRVRSRAAWQDRESARRAAGVHALAGPFSGAAVSVWDALTDPEPSSEPLPRPVVDAEFRGRERSRYGTGARGGRSSADPAALRGFVSATSGLDTAASGEATRVRAAWSRFRSSCAWVQVDRGSMPAGFDRYVHENDEARSWITKVAQAFEDAGGNGALSDAVLDIAAVGRAAPAVQGLLAAGLTPAAVAAKWAALGLTKADVSALRALPTSVLSELGNLEGIPYWAKSAANVVVLNQRMADVELEIDRLQSMVASAGDGSRVLAQQLTTLRSDLRSLRNINATLNEKRFDGPRYLISLTDDEPPLAAVSIGDLDTADSVTWAVPGMNTTTADMSSWTTAAQNIYDQQNRRGNAPDRAVVAWIGYDAPTPSEVLFMSKATKGGAQLAASIRGLASVRPGHTPETNIVAHSYGTTTAAVALAEDDVSVDRFVALGSAGLPDNIKTADDLHAGHVYASQAKDAPLGHVGQGDEWASFGRDHSVAHKVDPTAPSFGATVFGSDGTTTAGGERLKPVLHHDPLNGDGQGYLDRGTESVHNVGLATTGRDTELSPAEPR